MAMTNEEKRSRLAERLSGANLQHNGKIVFFWYILKCFYFSPSTSLSLYLYLAACLVRSSYRRGVYVYSEPRAPKAVHQEHCLGAVITLPLLPVLVSRLYHYLFNDVAVVFSLLLCLLPFSPSFSSFLPTFLFLFSRILVSVIAGVACGILGLTNLWGVLLYAFSSLVLTACIALKANFKVEVCISACMYFYILCKKDVFIYV